LTLCNVETGQIIPDGEWLLPVPTPLTKKEFVSLDAALLNRTRLVLDALRHGSVFEAMQSFCQRLCEGTGFRSFVLGLILFAALLVGLETNAALMARAGGLLQTLDRVVLALFVVELAVRIVACGRRPWRFLADPWNVFDFVIVAVCLLPVQAGFAAVLRLVRVLRVMRLITAVPKLQILVGALLKSIPSMAYVGLLLSVLFYIYAVLGVSLFGRTDPEHFGTLGAAALTLFQVVTLEGWADIMRAQFAAQSVLVTVGYFVSFILLGTMTVLNLLIGVIVSGMDEARQEMEDAELGRHVAATGAASLSDDVVALKRQAAALQDALSALQRRLK